MQTSKSRSVQVLALLRRVDATGTSRPSTGPRPRFNSPTNQPTPFTAGQTLKKPALASPALPAGGPGPPLQSRFG
ncbi:unnamed protein product [Effrenium voratum]|nr:unnamed protein product [Effrenium voratum]